MQLSPLFSALLHIHQTHRTDSLKYLGIFSASAVMLGSSPLVWAASDMTADSKEVPVAIFDTIVVDSIVKELINCYKAKENKRTKYRYTADASLYVYA